MKILIAVVFGCLLIILSFSKYFNDQLLDAATKDIKESERPVDKLIGGLLTADFDEGSCLSRYHKYFLYRKPSPYMPSEYLVSELRSYEMLHKRCGPDTKAYKEATEKLSRDEYYASESNGECRYIVWLARDGLGNRLITLASVFLYAILTERIILVDNRKDVSDLLCEPFPGTSWLLPLDFPMLNYTYAYGYNKEYPRCYGTMLENHAINSTSIPPHLYLHNIHDSRDSDKLFFCQKDQSFIDKVPWLIIQTNAYFVPSLWLNPTFQTKLVKLFPQKETVFHHLARYLFHPTNEVWDMVTKYYDAHLSNADERLGIQIRVFGKPSGYFKHVMDQVVACTQREKLLPEFEEESKVNISKPPKLKVVLVASLYPEYSVNLTNMFLARPSSTGEIIEVYQPSAERVQQTDKKSHDQKALAEMYLLSLTDNIVTSGWSTFGYVSYSLGGLKPWLLYQPVNFTTPNPPCVRSKSMEPCYHTPPSHGCEADWGTNSGKILPFVRHCEDMMYGGLKLYDDF
ncbi:unnamed protein product [Arabidopsis thaliana]|uniref:Fucosyltransferase n=1 Tax=Arabidopsis thaliana TaxID=3702 RepID=A0A7G2EA97_ARATH|nr:unnamed protein product [Arabidopsis thaliana]